MNVHEYQAKGLLREYGIEVPPGRFVTTAAEAEQAARDIGGTVVVKAQVHAGGRGKAGGIRVVKTPEQAREAASEMVGMRLVTKQTGAEGKVVSRLYVEAGSKIEGELYLALLVDRATQNVAILGLDRGRHGHRGGRARDPEKILTVQVDPLVGVCDFQARELGKKLGLTGKRNESFVGLVRSVYRLFVEKDVSLAEVNPLVISGDGVIPLDCKLNFDSNALFRHKDIVALRDPDEEDPREAEAAKYDLNRVSLDGDIGCMVNGAGLAMATMDIIQYAGAKPANFLDVGGGADAERVAHAFRLILSTRT